MRHLITFLFLVVSLSAQAQESGKLFIASGGNFNDLTDFVTVGFFEDPNYTVIDTIFTQAVQDVLIDSVFAYVAAVDSLIKYDLSTGQRVKSIQIDPSASFKSLYKLEVYQDKLFACKWFADNARFIEVYDKNDLSLISDSLPGIDKQAQGMAITSDGTAYISQNETTPNFADTLGVIKIVDLNDMSLVGEFELTDRTEAFGDIYLMDDVVITLNGGDKTIIAFDIENQSADIWPIENMGVALSGSYYGARSQMLDNQLYYITDSGVAFFDFDSSTINEVVNEVDSPTAFAVNPVTKSVFVSKTDFSTYGTGEYYSESGELISTVDIGIAPEAMAYDPNSIIALALNTLNKDIQLEMYPNPTVNYLNVFTDFEATAYKVVDLNGRILKDGLVENHLKFEILTNDLNQGYYTLILFDKEGKAAAEHFIKQ